MEIFLLVIVLILLIVTISNISTVTAKVTRLQRQLDELLQGQVTIKASEHQAPDRTKESEMEEWLATKQAKITEQEVPLTKEVEPLEEVLPPPIPAQQEEQVFNLWPEPTPQPEAKVETFSVPEPETTVVEESVSVPYSNPPIAPAPRKKINYEKFIGENLFGKIGILVLVIGVGLFVKYAIDQDWINEQLRTIFGFGVGGALLVLAKRLNKQYRTFSLLLAGGAFAIFYVTVAIAYHYYHLFSQPVAFGILVVTTLFMSGLAILYNQRELAWVALVGGFIAPFMVSSGSGNYMVLFTYLSILNVGMFGLSFRQKWSELPVISFLFSNLIMLTYVANLTRTATYDVELEQQLPLITSRLFWFATAFYLVFLLPVFSILRSEGKTMRQTLMMVVVANNFAYLFFGLYFLKGMDLGFKTNGLLALAIALVNLVLYLSLRKQEGHGGLRQLLLSQLIIFGSLFIPLQIDDTYLITLALASEMVVLLWLFGQIKVRTYEVFALIIMALTGIALLFVLFDYSETSLVAFANSRFMTALYFGAAALGSYQLMRYYKETFTEAVLMKSKLFMPIVAIAGTLTVCYAVIAEMGYYLGVDNTHIFTLTMVTETILLIGLFGRTKLRMYEFFSLTAILAGGISLLAVLFGDRTLNVHMFANSDFFTIAYCGAVAMGCYLLLMHYRTAFEAATLLKPELFIPLSAMAGLSLLYYAVVYELGSYLEGEPSFLAPVLFTTAYLLLLSIVFRKQLPVGRFSPLYMIAMGLVALLYAIDVLYYAPYLNGTTSTLLSSANLVLIIALSVFVARPLYASYRANGRVAPANQFTIYLNIVSTVTWICFLFWLQKLTGHEQELGTGLSIGLATAGAVQMALGMLRKNYLLRKISLVTFSIALVKLVLMDLWAMQTVGKIVVFVLLGTTLLVLSFLYQKLKNVLFKEDHPEQGEELEQGEDLPSKTNE